ncbi:MAG TPA: hypothetical protein VHK69_19405 [Chitinophagaceae bacterium]|jgi:photosystem II stability/assembly factor-like uncharacterized protein|nr:hypothetical protein [Chitinophagaceae bacterium]
MRITIGAYLAMVFFIVSCSKGKQEAQPEPAPRFTDSLTGWQVFEHTIPGDYMNDMAFFGQTGFITNNKGIYRSVDGGRTWTPVPGDHAGIHSLAFLDSQHGYGIGRNRYTYTVDGGHTWHTRSENGWDNGEEIQFVTPAKGFKSMDHSLYSTSDTGKTWKKETGISCEALYFTDSARGWALLRNNIHITRNGGRTWETKGTELGYLFSLHFTDSLYGWGSDENYPKLYRTTDGGETWTTIALPAGFRDLHFTDRQNGYAVSGYTIWKTTDGGTNWFPFGRSGLGGIVELFIDKQNVLWAAGKGRVLKKQL